VIKPGQLKVNQLPATYPTQRFLCDTENKIVCELVRFLTFGYDTRYDTIRYDSVYLTCSKKLTGSQLNPPHGTNKKLKCETKNNTMSMIGPVQSRCHEGSPVGKRSLRWKDLLKR